MGFALEGQLLSSQKKRAEAAVAFRNALRGNRAIAERSTYAALQAAGKPDQAAAMAQRWQKEHPKDACCAAIWAQQSMQAKDYRAAAQHYQAILEVEPDNTVALNNLAWALNELGDPKVARICRACVHARSVLAFGHGYARLDTGAARGCRAGSRIAAQGQQPSRRRPPTSSSILPRRCSRPATRRGAKSELEKLAAQTEPSPARTEAQQMLKKEL